jgi:iron complex outermembrane receptor protein
MHHPTTHPSSGRPFYHRALAGLLLLALPVLALAQASTGTITGRVFNPATHEYIRNAEIRIPGTSLAVHSEEGGFFRLPNVPSGQVTVVATYPGHETKSAVLTVTPADIATHDFELGPTTGRRGSDDVVQLGAFVVETEREGQAKAVAEQRMAMNVKTVMSADNFGDMSEGNIGEFLKYMPGITIDYVETDTRAARMGGMDARYGYVTLDGNTQASGNSGSLGADSRQFEFESVSMNNIEAIEVNKTLSADMSADAPAGTINLRTRSALDLKRARFGYSTGFIWNSMEHSIRKTPRHDDTLHAKVRPRFSFDYTNAFFDRKLGITVNGAFTNIYKEQFRNSYNFDYTSAQAIAAGAPLITAINFKDGPKIVEKSAGGIKLDYEPFRNLRLTTAISYSWFNDFFANRNLNFVTTTANLGPGSSLTKVVANNSNNTNTRLDQSGESTGKLKDNTNLSWMAKYRRGDWTGDLSLLYSRARETRGGLAYETIGNTGVRLGRVGWTAVRDSVSSPTWHITQDSGPDWYDYNNWGKADVQGLNSNEQYGKTEEYTAKLDLKRTMRWSIPTSYKFGLAQRVTFRHRKVIDSYNATYIGTGTLAAPSSMPKSPAMFLIDKGWGGGIRPLPVPDKQAMYYLSKLSPEQFVRSEANLATDLNNLLGSFQSNQETVRAAYLMQESRLGRAQLQAGLRFEDTGTISSVLQDVPVAQNPFAIRNANGTFSAANTRDYVNYRWSKGKKTTWGGYGDFLPSASLKYPLTKDLNFKFGYNKAIKRPDLDKTAGPWRIDVGSTGDITITIPNPDLGPERSEKFSGMFEYYFEPAGALSVHLFQTNITGAVDDGDPLSAEDAGFGSDPSLRNLFFKTFGNLAEGRTVKGIELNYSQQLAFFRNEILRGFTIFGSYSQYSVSPRPRDAKFFPRNATGGVSWRYRKFFTQVNGTWTDETFTGGNTVPATSPYTPGAPEYLRPRVILFVNASYRLTRTTSLFVSGDRAYDSGKTWFYKYDGRIRQMERYGSQWSLGFRGEY